MYDVIIVGIMAALIAIVMFLVGNAVGESDKIKELVYKCKQENVYVAKDLIVKCEIMEFNK